jgi:pimeloyl-ACP methyl ester carboxylesterase
LLDHLGIHRVQAVGLSGGGITLLHMATQQPDRVEAMIAISAPPYFPPQARALQRRYSVIGTEILIPCGEGILSKLETEAGRVSSPNVETFFDYFRPYWNEIVVPSFKLIAK